jgi:hypothetical protein
MKPHEVEATPKGRIDGACEGKNARDDILRFMAPCELVFIVHYEPWIIAQQLVKL